MFTSIAARRPSLVHWFVLLAAAALVRVAGAAEPVVIDEQAEARGEAQADPPGRVARLSYRDGEVSMTPAGTTEWVEAVLNRPLTRGDQLWVERDGRAELQIGSSTVHLDGDTGVSFIDLDDDALRLNLTDGAATIRVHRKRDGESIRVETPNATVTLLHPGEYHIEVNAAGDATTVKTRSGESAVDGERDSYIVRANEVGVFTGTNSLAADMSRLGPRTAFENWANDRDRRNESAVSSRYVSRDVIGYEDLDDHGEWVREPEYGHVWRPIHVSSGWAPYRYGRWAYISPWGWTWIDDAPWGFAPFHYGRWVHVRHRWCWVPGPLHVRPIYAPALVGWIGAPGVSVSISLGSGIGWFPLAPHEVYVPHYWYSRRYIHNVNVSNTIIVNNTYITNVYRGRHYDHNYRYRNLHDAVTAVHREVFTGGRSIGGRQVRLDDRDLRRWSHDARPPRIEPQRESIYAGRVRDESQWRGRTQEGRGTGRPSGRLPERGDFNRNDQRRDAVVRGSGDNPKERGDFRASRPESMTNGGKRPQSRDADRSGSAVRGNSRAESPPVNSLSPALPPQSRNDASPRIGGRESARDSGRMSGRDNDVARSNRDQRYWDSRRIEREQPAPRVQQEPSRQPRVESMPAQEWSRSESRRSGSRGQEARYREPPREQSRSYQPPAERREAERSQPRQPERSEAAPQSESSRRGGNRGGEDSRGGSRQRESQYRER